MKIILTKSKRVHEFDMQPVDYLISAQGLFGGSANVKLQICPFPKSDSPNWLDYQSVSFTQIAYFIVQGFNIKARFILNAAEALSEVEVAVFNCQH